MSLHFNSFWHLLSIQEITKDNGTKFKHSPLHFGHMPNLISKRLHETRVDQIQHGRSPPRLLVLQTDLVFSDQIYIWSFSLRNKKGKHQVTKLGFPTLLALRRSPGFLVWPAPMPGADTMTWLFPVKLMSILRANIENWTCHFGQRLSNSYWCPETTKPLKSLSFWRRSSRSWLNSAASTV